MMSHTRIGSFNVENMFERPKVMGRNATKHAAPVLAAHARFNELIALDASRRQFGGVVVRRRLSAPSAATSRRFTRCTMVPVSGSERNSTWSITARMIATPRPRAELVSGITPESASASKPSPVLVTRI